MYQEMPIVIFFLRSRDVFYLFTIANDANAFNNHLTTCQSSALFSVHGQVKSVTFVTKVTNYNLRK